MKELMALPCTLCLTFWLLVPFTGLAAAVGHLMTWILSSDSGD